MPDGRGIVTVTLNPAVDHTVWVERLAPGATNRSTAVDVRIGGKGVNVARVAARAGVRVTAIGIAGADAGRIEGSLATDGVSARFVAVAGETRTNLKIIELESGRLTEVNGTGPTVDAAALATLERELVGRVEAERPAAVVMAGSLPAGVPSTVYASWTTRLRTVAEPPCIIVDASDEALRAAAAAGPFLIKPNAVEASQLLSRPVETVEAGVRAAADLSRPAATGAVPTVVLLSLGGDGAVVAVGGRSRHLPARALSTTTLASTVGAGDALVATIAGSLATGSLDPAAMARPDALELIAPVVVAAMDAAARQIEGGRP